MTSMPRQHWQALAAVLLGVILATLDTAIANTALPSIAADLRAPAAAAIWVINAYQLAVVATMLPFAALGDRIGPRRIFLIGTGLFTAASLACTLAHTLPLLAAARAGQGIGAGAIMSVNIALIRLLYPPARLGAGMGMNALVVAISFAVGPSVASLVLSVAPWPWLFGINVPLGLLALACAWPTLPVSARGGESFDAPAALLCALTMGALIFTLSAVAQLQPWPWIAASLGLTLLAGATLLQRQAGRSAPILPVDLLARPMFALSVVTAVAAFTTQGLAFVSLPFYFEQVLKRDPVQSGFLLTAWPVVVALTAPVAGPLSDRHPPALLGGIGLALLAAGMAGLALLPQVPRSATIVGCLMVCGAGFGLFQAPNLKALMSSAPPQRAGGASGVIGVSRLLGQSCGAALVALCFHLGGLHGAAWALALGAGFAGFASLASAARLWL